MNKQDLESTKNNLIVVKSLYSNSIEKMDEVLKETDWVLDEMPEELPIAETTKKFKIQTGFILQLFVEEIKRCDAQIQVVDKYLEMHFSNGNDEIDLAS